VIGLSLSFASSVGEQRLCEKPKKEHLIWRPRKSPYLCVNKPLTLVFLDVSEAGSEPTPFEGVGAWPGN